MGGRVRRPRARGAHAGGTGAPDADPAAAHPGARTRGDVTSALGVRSSRVLCVCRSRVSHVSAGGTCDVSAFTHILTHALVPLLRCYRHAAPRGPERTGSGTGPDGREARGAAGPFDTPPFGWAFGVMRRAPTPQPRRYTSTVAETQHMRTECMRVCMVPNQSPWLDGRVNMESLARFMDIPAAHGACQLSVCMAAAINHRHGVARDGRCKVPCDCSMATR